VARPIPTILLLASASLFAGEWSDIDRKLPKNWEVKLAPTIAKHLHLEKAAVIGSFRFKGWSIIHVGTYVDDDRFLFFNGDPFTTIPVTEWGGAAGSDETNEVKAWVIQHAKGIPDHLASFFAWHMTKEHN
jgi:hypothetical protein